MIAAVEGIETKIQSLIFNTQKEKCEEKLRKLRQLTGRRTTRERRKENEKRGEVMISERLEEIRAQSNEVWKDRVSKR